MRKIFHLREREDAADTCRPPHRPDCQQVAQLRRGRPLRGRRARAGWRCDPTSGWPTQTEAVPGPDEASTLPTLKDTKTATGVLIFQPSSLWRRGRSLCRPRPQHSTARFVFGDAGLGPQRASHSDHLPHQQEVSLHLGEMPVSLLQGGEGGSIN